MTLICFPRQSLLRHLEVIRVTASSEKKAWEKAEGRRQQQPVYLPKTFIPSLNSRPFFIMILVSSGASFMVSFNMEMTALVVLASSA